MYLCKFILFFRLPKQKSLFEFKGFKRTIEHQGQTVDINHQPPPPKKKLLDCPHCCEKFQNNTGFTVHLKYKHTHEYAASNKISFEKVDDGQNVKKEVRSLISKLVEIVAEEEKDVITVDDTENKKVSLICR